MPNIYDNPINQPVIEEPKRYSKKIIWYIVLGFIVIIGTVYLRGLSLMKEAAKSSSIDQVQFLVDITCLMANTGQRPDSKETTQALLQKYNLTPSELIVEEKNIKLLYNTDLSFKKKVQDSLLKSGCK